MRCARRDGARERGSKWRRRQWPTSFAVRKYRTAVRESVREVRDEEAFYDAG